MGRVEGNGVGSRVCLSSMLWLGGCDDGIVCGEGIAFGDEFEAYPWIRSQTLREPTRPHIPQFCKSLKHRLRFLNTKCRIYR